jgi:hypothetical protein
VTHLQAVRDVLLAASEVAALVGTRIYPSVAPQGVARPFVVLTLVSAVPYHTHDGRPAELLEAARVQVRAYGPEYAATHAVATAIDDVLGALAGEPLSATKDNEQDGYEDATSLHYVASDYLVQRTRG